MLADRIEYIAHQLTLSTGRTRVIYTLGLGALAALAQAPFHFFPAMIIAFTGFVWVLDGAVSEQANRSNMRTAFGLGWWFGFGYFLVGLYWVGNAFLVEAQEFGILMPFGVAGLCAGLALFWGFGAAFARFFWTSHGTRVIALAVGFALVEYLRGHVLTGFPWNALGYGLAFTDIINQGFSIIGLWGYTFLAVFIAAIPALCIDDSYIGLRRTLYTCAVLCVAGLAGFGIFRLYGGEARPAQEAAGITVRIVQPNIDQGLIQRGSADDRMVQFQTLMDLSTGTGQPQSAAPSLILWPETAYPYLWESQPDKLGQIQAMLQGSSTLITGVHRVESGGPTGRMVYNSLYGLDSKGRIATVYDKVHLVPFGEYLPFQAMLESIGLEQITRQHGGFAAGKTRAPLHIPGLPSFLPLICYEIIFPSQLQLGDERPQFLLNITNDGWFGHSSGPYQHLHQARMRAIEEGLPILRAANTGISAIIDSHGKSVQFLPLGKRGSIEGNLPQVIESTLYSQFRDIPFLVVILCSILMITISKKYK